MRTVWRKRKNDHFGDSLQLDRHHALLGRWPNVNGAVALGAAKVQDSDSIGRQCLCFSPDHDAPLKLTSAQRSIYDVDR